MNCILQEINTHKNNLLILVNNLINTQIITEEIYINNEIRKETEFLNILLNNKQNNIIYNTNQDNNININPSAFQQFPMMNPIQLNMNPIMINNLNLNAPPNNNLNNEEIINIKFCHGNSGNLTIIQCNRNDHISDVVRKYKEKTGDYNNNFFLFNARDLDLVGNKTLFELKIFNEQKIEVLPKKSVEGGYFDKENF